MHDHPHPRFFTCPNLAGLKPVKASVIDRHPVNKIIQGDWIWHPNRGNTDPRSAWHNHRGQSLTIMLWGDNHVSALTIPVTTDGGMIADPANQWW